MPKLRYVGKDRTTDWLPGVPARDLTASEAAQWPEAAKSEFYTVDKRAEKKPRKPRAPRVETKPEETPAGHGEEQEN